MWCNPNAFMKIWLSRLNHNDLPLLILSGLLISSRRRSNIPAQFQNIINSLSLIENVFLDILSDQSVWHLNPWISWLLPLVDSFPRPGSAWNQDFVERIRRFHLLNAKYLFSKMWNETLWSGNQLNHFEHNFGLDYVFST